MKKRTKKLKREALGELKRDLRVARRRGLKQAKGRMLAFQEFWQAAQKRLASAQEKYNESASLAEQLLGQARNMLDDIQCVLDNEPKEHNEKGRPRDVIRRIHALCAAWDEQDYDADIDEMLASVAEKHPPPNTDPVEIDETDLEARADPDEIDMAEIGADEDDDDNRVVDIASA